MKFQISLFILAIALTTFMTACSDSIKQDEALVITEEAISEVVETPDATLFNEEDMLSFSSDLENLSTNPRDFPDGADASRSWCSVSGGVFNNGWPSIRVTGQDGCSSSPMWKLYVRRGRADGKEVANAEVTFNGNFWNYIHSVRSDSRYIKAFLYRWSTGCNCWEPFDFEYFANPN